MPPHPPPTRSPPFPSFLPSLPLSPTNSPLPLPDPIHPPPITPPLTPSPPPSTIHPHLPSHPLAYPHPSALVAAKSLYTPHPLPHTESPPRPLPSRSSRKPDLTPALSPPPSPLCVTSNIGCGWEGCVPMRHRPPIPPNPERDPVMRWRAFFPTGPRAVYPRPRGRGPL